MLQQHRWKLTLLPGRFVFINRTLNCTFTARLRLRDQESLKTKHDLFLIELITLYLKESRNVPVTTGALFERVEFELLISRNEVNLVFPGFAICTL